MEESSVEEVEGIAVAVAAAVGAPATAVAVVVEAREEVERTAEAGVDDDCRGSG